MIDIKTQRYIYMFYLLILLFALSWRLANAGGHDFCRITQLEVNELDDETGIVISLSTSNRPVASFSGENKCLTLDFKDTGMVEALADKSFAGRDLRLGYITSSPSEPGQTRIRLFLRPGCLASIRYLEQDVMVKITEKATMATTATVAPGFLLSPAEEKYAPVVISLQEAPLLPILHELATAAGLAIEAGTNLPEKCTLDLQADGPIEALKQVVRDCKLKLTRRGQTWQVSGATRVEKQIYACVEEGKP